MDDLGQTLLWFVVGSSFVLTVFALLAGRQRRPVPGAPAGRRAVARHEFGTVGRAQLPTGPMDQAVSERLQHQDKKAELQKRLIQAGLYKRNADALFATARILLGLGMVGLGVLVSSLGLLSMPMALTVGAVCGLAGTIAPSFWLDHVKRERQTKIRRALPDALDVLSVCLEGGLSLSAGLVRVSRELSTAHPLLAMELSIVERETQMGRTTGEALRQFANRCELDEVRSLASVITQAEKMGGSVTGALQVYSDTLREQRQQRAQELAQKAAIKILFPTVLCIFPGLFVVILGPAAIMIYQTLILGKH